MNKKQKITIIVAAIIIAAGITLWLADGTAIFTKTQILVVKKDPLFGTTYKTWKDQFVLGLLPSGFSLTLESLALTSLSGAVIVVSGILFYVFKKGRNEKSI